MAAAPLLSFDDVWHELGGFLGQFLAVGAAGFWLTARRAAASDVRTDSERAWLTRSTDAAATRGIIGAFASIAMLYESLSHNAAEKQMTLVPYLQSQPPAMLAVGFALVALLGFALARARVALGWWLALAVIVSPFRSLLTGAPINRLVNPMHRLGGALWIGTLWMMVNAGLRFLPSSGIDEMRRAQLTKRMVDAFSPLALGSVALLGIMGVITAWNHLGRIEALWTTPYGATLIVKLVVVAGVLALGAMNWRKHGPASDTPAGAKELLRAAELEAILGTVVLVITAVLVSLPSPKG